MLEEEALDFLHHRVRHGHVSDSLSDSWSSSDRTPYTYRSSGSSTSSVRSSDQSADARYFERSFVFERRLARFDKLIILRWLKMI